MFICALSSFMPSVKIEEIIKKYLNVIVTYYKGQCKFELCSLYWFHSAASYTVCPDCTASFTNNIPKKSQWPNWILNAWWCPRMSMRTLSKL